MTAHERGRGVAVVVFDTHDQAAQLVSGLSIGQHIRHGVTVTRTDVLEVSATHRSRPRRSPPPTSCKSLGCSPQHRAQFANPRGGPGNIPPQGEQASGPRRRRDHDARDTTRSSDRPDAQGGWLRSCRRAGTARGPGCRSATSAHRRVHDRHTADRGRPTPRWRDAPRWRRSALLGLRCSHGVPRTLRRQHSGRPRRRRRSCRPTGGAWHQITIRESGQLIHITPGPNSDARPLRTERQP